MTVQLHKFIYGYYNRELDIPQHKIKYLLYHGGEVLLGAFGGIKTRHGIALTTEVFDIFFDTVSAKLTGDTDIEYEFSAKEYDTLMGFKEFCS